MAREAQSKMLGLLPPELATVAVDLSVIAGSREYCFPLTAASAVLENLLRNGVTLLGGDLWDLKDGEYYALGESWYTNSVPGESAVIREARVRETAGEFFARYANATKNRVTFVVRFNSAA